MRLPILLTLAALAGCAHECPPTPAPRIVDTACSWVQPLTASASDTPATKREILAYERARQTNCPENTK